MSSNGLSQREREERIAELEGRLAHRNYVGVSIPVSVLAIAAVSFLLGRQWPDLKFFFASATPLALGTEGAYRFEQLASNQYVQIHGTPTRRGVYEIRNGKRDVVVGLRGTPIVVQRRPLPGEEQARGNRGQAPPQPNQTPFAVRGRLIAQADAPAHAETIQQLAQMGELQPRAGGLWIVLEGERPRSDLKTILLTAILLVFGVFNGWFLLRNLRHRLRPLQPPRETLDGGT
jgi:hypothetical protein